MTRTFPIYKKCPKCNLIIVAKEVLSGYTFGVGLNYVPIGTPFLSFSVLSCPRCHFADYKSNFTDVKEMDKPKVLAEGNDNNAEILLKVAKKREKENKLKEAFKLLLAASWYTHRENPRYVDLLKKILKLILKCFEEVKLTMKEQRDLLNLGINISNQIGLDKVKKEAEELNNLGKEKGMILI